MGMKYAERLYKERRWSKATYTFDIYVSFNNVLKVTG